MVFIDLMLCIQVPQPFHRNQETMIMPAPGSNGTLVPIYRTVWHLIQEDSHLHKSTTLSVKKTRNLKEL